MKYKIIIGIGILLLALTYLIATAVSIYLSIITDTKLVYYDALEDKNVTGSWNMSDDECLIWYREYQDEIIIPRAVIRRCFIKDNINTTIG